MDLRALLPPEGPPRTVGELAAVVGVRLGAEDLAASSLGYLTLPSVVDAPPVTSIWAHYGWNGFHENPPASVDALASKTVLAFSVVITSGLDELAASLSAAVGVAPRSLATGYVIDHWVIRPDGRGGGVVAHYDELPDFAVAPPAPGRRAEILNALFSLVARAGGHDALAGATAIATDGGGVIIATGRGGLDVSLVPSILAIDLVALLGWKDVASRCYDRHQTDWSIHLVTRDADGDVVAVVPCIGAWPVRARLDRRPNGGEVSTPRPPPLGGIHRLGPTDVVRRISIGGPP